MLIVTVSGYKMGSDFLFVLYIFFLHTVQTILESSTVAPASLRLTLPFLAQSPNARVTGT